LNRQITQRALVFRAFEHNIVEIPATAPSRALVLAEKQRQRILAHAQEFDIDFIHIDRDHRQPPAFARGQHTALGREPDRRSQFPGIHLAPDFLPEAGTIGGGEIGRDDASKRSSALKSWVPTSG